MAVLCGRRREGHAAGDAGVAVAAARQHGSSVRMVERTVHNAIQSLLLHGGFLPLELALHTSQFVTFLWKACS